MSDGVIDLLLYKSVVSRLDESWLKERFYTAEVEVISVEREFKT